ncbi:glycosyltransferase family 4 protein [Akkermansia sp.]|uniref:glycosyltransferase family 4 protein n=1 Tax=Akkermansia sp. TaxID=1872421 RepID=UPI0025B7D112|nr:glycosyltransferase family 4 protein [Akkermansia sp.]MCC8149606.1 glycosyltransferase family 4 protein [Akkermansia sp.]
MKHQAYQPIIVILADMPLGRLLPHEFQNHDHSLTPWIYALFNDLEDQKDYQIHWVTFKKYVSHSTTRRLKGQIIHILPASSLAVGLFTNHFLAAKKIRKLLRSLRPDLVHAWGIELSYAKACMTQPCAKLLSYQGALHAYCQRAKMSLFPRLQAFWEKRITPSYPFITCESPWAKDRILEIAPSSHVSLIEYGVEESFYHVERHPSVTPECLFVGTLYELKGLRYLVQAFSDPSLQHVKLYIVGSGSLRAELEPASTPNIHWTGPLNRPELQKRLSSAWCLVHPTLADTGPTIIKEARCMNLPVITTVNAGSKQYVEDGKSGYIIPVKDSAAICRAVLSLTDSLGKNITMGLQGADEAKEALRIQLTSRKFLSLYKSLLSVDPETSTN